MTHPAKVEKAKAATPRTDALANSTPDSCGLREMADAYNGMLDHARELERQNADLLATLRKNESHLARFNSTSGYRAGEQQVLEATRAAIARVRGAE